MHVHRLPAGMRAYGVFTAPLGATTVASPFAAAFHPAVQAIQADQVALRASGVGGPAPVAPATASRLPLLILAGATAVAVGLIVFIKRKRR